MKKIALDEKQKGMLRVMLNTAPDGGYTLDEVRAGCKVLDVLDKSAGTVDFEDAHFAFVRQRLGKQKWAAASLEIVRFADLFQE